MNLQSLIHPFQLPCEPISTHKTTHSHQYTHIHTTTVCRYFSEHGVKEEKPSHVTCLFLVSGFYAVAYLALLYIPSSSSRAYTLLYIQFEYEFNFDCINFKMA